MSVHQIIYTSCKKGISNQDSGFQVYSFDKEYESEVPKREQKYILPEELGKSSSYKALDGVLLSEETIHDMPQVFAYRHLADGRSAVTKNTCCRDFTTPKGRWGNVFSHSIVYEESDAPWYLANSTEQNSSGTD